MVHACVKIAFGFVQLIVHCAFNSHLLTFIQFASKSVTQIAVRSESQGTDTPAPNPAVRQSTFQRGTRLAELLYGLDYAAHIGFEVVTQFLLQTPLCVIFDTLNCSVYKPASKISN
jgi:hypothetical protein